MKPATDLPQFQFLDELGTGGTAQVCKVLTKENRVVALKTILQTDTITLDEFKKLATREKTLLQNINFPGIVKVFEVQTKDPCYISLEFCPGKTLEHYNKIEDMQMVLNILSSIAVNLEFLHLKSIVHADLKPDNVFMPEDITLFATDKLTFTKLSDFSLGKFEVEDISVRAGIGTVGYMAPETINDNIVTHQSDLFALGVIAYQILTGHHPFITEDADPVKINSRILEDQPIALSAYRNDIPQELESLINLLLEKDFRKRVQTAWDVCTYLRNAGATYPFEKVLNPKYTIDTKSSYESNIQSVENYQNRVNTISNKNSEMLRLVFADNFNKKNIYYDKKKFHFRNNPLLSSYLIRKELQKFSSLSYTKKKDVIQLSLYDNSRNLISSLLPQLLHSVTIRKTAHRLACKFINEQNYIDATKLFVLSGELLKAENAGYQAAMQYKNENKIDIAIELLDKVISYGTLVKRQFEIKSLYMVKGDFLKDIGEADKAEIVYNELIDLYNDQPEDELLAETYKDLGDLYKMKKQPKEGIKSLEMALMIFKKLGNELEISKTYNNLGNIYAVLNDVTISLSYFRKALKIQRKLSAFEEVASTLNNISVTYAMTSKFKKALKIFKISLSIKKDIGNKGEIARALNNIGYCYEVLGNPKKAIEMLEEALRYNKEIESKREILYNLENLTIIMFKTGRLRESLSFLKEGISLSAELQDQPHIGLFNLYMGAILVRMGKLNDAKLSFDIVEKILEVIEDDTLLANLYIEKAKLALLLEKYESASDSLNQGQTICDKIKDKTITIKVLLLKLKIKKDTEILNKAESIINELELTNDDSYLNALKLNQFLTTDNSLKVKLEYDKLAESIHNSDENIEQCHFLNILSRYELHFDNLEKAIIYINKSLKLAKSRGLIFDRFDALIIHGEILSREKEYEQCFTVYKEALEIAKGIFSQLDSDEDKNAFQNKKDFQFLISEIKNLSKIISNKKEQI